jgi:hypothetical protein
MIANTSLHLTLNQRVAGSIPARSTIIQNGPPWPFFPRPKGLSGLLPLRGFVAFFLGLSIFSVGFFCFWDTGGTIWFSFARKTRSQGFKVFLQRFFSQFLPLSRRFYTHFLRGVIEINYPILWGSPLIRARWSACKRGISFPSSLSQFIIFRLAEVLFKGSIFHYKNNDNFH